MSKSTTRCITTISLETLFIFRIVGTNVNIPGGAETLGYRLERQTAEDDAEAYLNEKAAIQTCAIEIFEERLNGPMPHPEPFRIVTFLWWKDKIEKTYY